MQARKISCLLVQTPALMWGLVFSGVRVLLRGFRILSPSSFCKWTVWRVLACELANERWAWLENSRSWGSWSFWFLLCPWLVNEGKVFFLPLSVCTFKSEMQKCDKRAGGGRSPGKKMRLTLERCKAAVCLCK